MNVAPATRLTDILVNTYPNMEIVAKNNWMRLPPKRLFMYSGIVYTPDAMYTGKNTQPWIETKVASRYNWYKFDIQTNCIPSKTSISF